MEYLDRVDEVDGIIRIIDYKTGKVSKSEVTVNNWENFITDDRKNTST